MKKYIVEFIGTFFLVLTIVLAVNALSDNNFLPPLIIGFILMLLVYFGGPISGAHYNPAVTLAMILRGKTDKSEGLPYIIAQISAAIIAAYLVRLVFDHTKVVEAGTLPENIAAAGIAEMIGTFILVWVILYVATTKRTEGNSYYGFAIGFTVFVIASFLGGFGTAGCFNPAVAIGIPINGLTSWATAGLTVSANIISGLFSAIVFDAVYRLDKLV